MHLISRVTCANLSLYWCTTVIALRHVLSFEIFTGALNLTREAGERSRAAQEQVDIASNVIVAESERNRRRTENLILHIGDRFNRTQEENEEKLAMLSAALNDMDAGIPELNDQVILSLLILFVLLLMQ